MNNQKIQHTTGSGNIFQDLGFADSDERLAKAKLAMRIESIIDKRKLRQKEAAAILEINQPKVSALMNGNLEGFSMERLMHFLNRLDQDIEIIIKSRPGRKTNNGSLRVAFG